MSNNQKNSTPIKATLRVKLFFDNVDDLKQFSTRDISKGGLFIITSQPKQEGTVVELVLMPPQRNERLIITGKVVRMVSPEKARKAEQQPGMGIMFIDLTEKIQEDLEALIKKLEEGLLEHVSKIKKPPPLPEGAERRSHRRIHPPLNFKINIPTPDKVQAFIDNEVEKGELFTKTGVLACVDQPVNLLINFPYNGREIKLPARVSRVISKEAAEAVGRSQGVHLRLCGPDTARRLLIEELFAHRNEQDDNIGDGGGAKVGHSMIQEGPAGITAGPLYIKPLDIEVQNGAGAPAKTASAPAEETARPGAASKATDEYTLLNEEQLKNQIALIAKQLKANYYAALGLNTAASIEKIKSAHASKAKILDPEIYQGQVSNKTLKALRETRRNLDEAVSRLTQVEQRVEYDLENGIAHTCQDQAYLAGRNRVQTKLREKYQREFPDNVEKAAVLIEKALKAIQENKMSIALSTIKMALKYDPWNERYQRILNSLQK